MKILFGLHNKIHHEIAQFEVNACRDMGMDVDTSNYGNSGEVSGALNSFILLFKNALSLRKKAIRQKSDVVYLNTAFDNKTVFRDLITVLLIKIFNHPVNVILKIHGSKEEIVLSKLNVLKSCLVRQVSLLLVLSNEERNNFLRIGVSPDKVQITANVLNKDLYQEDSMFREKTGIPRESIVLLFVGRFMKTKGILDLIEACRLLDKTSLKYQLFCLGDGPLKEKVAKLISEHHLCNIKLLGHIPETDTRYYYSNCDILILPTYHFEGFPMAIFQAVAAGKPIITTKIRAAADHLKENENCLWVEKQNPDELFNKIAKLSRSKILRSYMRHNNLALAEKFTAYKVAKRFIENYQNLHKG